MGVGGITCAPLTRAALLPRARYQMIYARMLHRARWLPPRSACSQANTCRHLQSRCATRAFMFAHPALLYCAAQAT